MSNRDIVRIGDNLQVNLSDVAQGDALNYTATPAFKIVKSTVQNATLTGAADGTITGFSATSHYRISHLHKEINDFASGKSDDISTAINTRESAEQEKSEALSTAIETRETALETLSTSIESKFNTLSTSLNTSISTLTVETTNVNTLFTNDYAGKQALLETQVDTISGDIRDSIEDYLAEFDQKRDDNQSQLDGVVNARELAVESLSNARVTNVTSLAGRVSSAVAARVSQEAQLEGIRSDAFDNPASTVNAKRDTILSTVWTPEIETLESDRITGDDDVQTTIDDVTAGIDSKLENAATAGSIQKQLNFILSNTNSTALDSLAELSNAAQAVDDSTLTDATTFADKLTLQDKSTDQRLDYLEKFCSAMSSFMHVIGDLDATPLSVHFPPTLADKTVYDSITVNYESYDQYPLLGTDTSGWKRLSDPVDPSTGGGGGGDDGGDGFGDVPTDAPDTTTIPAGDLTDANLMLDGTSVSVKVFTLSDTPNDAGDGVVDRTYAFDPTTPENLYEVVEGTPTGTYDRVPAKPMFVGDELWSDGSDYTISLSVEQPLPATTTVLFSDLDSGSVEIFGVTYTVLSNVNGDDTTSYSIENGGQIANVMENPITGEYTVDLYDATTVFLL